LCDRGRESGVASFGNRVWQRNDALAVRETLLQTCGIVIGAVRREDYHAMTASELGNNLQAADAAAACRRPQAAHFHPEYLHKIHCVEWEISRSHFPLLIFSVRVHVLFSSSVFGVRVSGSSRRRCIYAGNLNTNREERTEKRERQS
jgi:hypothetical protein